jgi:hypothetical protein
VASQRSGVRQPRERPETPCVAFIGGHEGSDNDLSTCRVLRVIRRRRWRLQRMKCEKRLLDWPGLVAWLLTMAAGYPGDGGATGPRERSASPQPVGATLVERLRGRTPRLTATAAA